MWLMLNQIQWIVVSFSFFNCFLNTVSNSWLLMMKKEYLRKSNDPFRSCRETLIYKKKKNNPFYSANKFQIILIWPLSRLTCLSRGYAAYLLPFSLFHSPLFFFLYSFNKRINVYVDIARWPLLIKWTKAFFLLLFQSNVNMTCFINLHIFTKKRLFFFSLINPFTLST